MQLGKLRREALRDMAERIGIAEMTSFVAAVIQSEQLGVSMAKVLRIQSDQMRVRRRQLAEEEAHKAPIKMLIPLAFIDFPIHLYCINDTSFVDLYSISSKRLFLFGRLMGQRLCRWGSYPTPATDCTVSSGDWLIGFIHQDVLGAVVWGIAGVEIVKVRFVKFTLLIVKKCGIPTKGEKICLNCNSRRTEI